MLGKFSVKKPYTVIVGVILVIVLGVISFMNMTTDLLPSMNFPYVIVYTTYIGATPEQIESEVTRPMEAAFATLTDIKSITSQSSDNVAMVALEFNDTADMNTAMIEINSEITTLSAGWSDSVGAPAIMKINPDMLPVSIVSVARDGMDIYELSEYVEETLIPEYEAINGVASVTASGMITQQVEVTIEQDRIDVLNNAILRDVDAQLADAEEQLDEAQAQISDGKAELARQKKSVMAQINGALSDLEDGEAQLSTAIAEMKTQRADLQAKLDEVNAGISQMEQLVNMTDEQRELLIALEKQLGELKSQKAELEKKLAELEKGQGNQALTAERAEAVSRRDALISERDILDKYIQDLKNSDGNAIAAEIESLNNQLAAEQTQLAFAQATLNEKTAARAATQQRIDELTQALGSQATAAPTAEATAAPEATAESTAAPTAENTPATAAPSAETTPATTAEVTPEVTAAATPEVTAQATAAPAPTTLRDILEELWNAHAEGLSAEEIAAELAAAQALLSQQDGEVAAAQAEVDRINGSISQLNSQIASKKEALDAVQSGDLTTRIEAAQRERDRLDSRIGILNAEIAAIDELLKGGSEAIDAARSALNELYKNIDKIESSEEYQALKLIADKDKFNAQYAAALEGKAQLEAGIATIDGYLKKLESGIIPGGMIEGVDKDTSIADAKDQLASARRKANSGFAEAEEQLESASAEVAEARAEFEKQRDEALKNAGIDGVITLETVAGLLGAQNMSMPAGYVYDVNEDQYLVRVGDKFTAIEDLRSFKLFSLGMDSVDEIRLTDVASVEITDNAAESFTKVNGQNGILLSIEKQSTFSTTDVADRVSEKNAELIAEIDGLTVVDMFNQGDYINLIVDSVLDNLISGGALAILVLLIFLLDWRPTVIVAISIPLSVVAAFVCMYFSGITLNVLSLSGLALGIGMLVDNSIVAIENIYRLRNEENMPILHACVLGVKQVGGSLFASTLTTICVFLPVVFVSGLARDLFVDLGLTIAFSLLASLVAAMTVVPAMSASLLKKVKSSKRKGLFYYIQTGYVKLLRGAMKVKFLVLLVAVALLAYAVMQVPKMGLSFMPEVNSTQMTATLAIDPEQDVKPQQDRALELMTRMMDIDGIENIGLSGDGGAMSAMSGGGAGSLTYYIIVGENTGRENAEIAEDIRKASEDMGMELNISTSTMDISMLTGSGITINIAGSETDTLQAIARDVAGIAATVEGATEINDGLQEAVPEIRITVDKELASDKNLTVGQVLQFVATKLAGKTEITQATLDGKNLSIYVLDGRNASITPDMLEDLEIEAVSGDKAEMVRIGDIANVTEALSFGTITRSNQQRTTSVSFQIAEGYSANHVSAALEEKLESYQAPEGYTVSLAGENETVSAIMQDLVFMVLVAILMIFLIMVAQFQSFKSPIIVLFTIPLAFTGGLLALQIFGMDLSIVSMIGFLVLSGVIVNNGIVFVDTVNQLRIGGMSKREALLETGRLRLRPILMTTLTTVLGMSTMALAQGMGAEMMQPMAVVTIGGLSYATLMTLFVVPSMYDLINGEKMSAREIQMAKEAAGMATEDAIQAEARAEMGEKEVPAAPEAIPAEKEAPNKEEKPAEQPAVPKEQPNVSSEQPAVPTTPAGYPAYMPPYGVPYGYYPPYTSQSQPQSQPQNPSYPPQCYVYPYPYGMPAPIQPAPIAEEPQKTVPEPQDESPNDLILPEDTKSPAERRAEHRNRVRRKLNNR